MTRFVFAAVICGCTALPQTPTGSAASEDASAAPLPTVATALSEPSPVEDASAQATPEHHHHGGDHGGH